MNKSMAEVLKELKRPFHSSKTEFKVASNTRGSSALCVAYVDARHVQERLNDVCEGWWSNTFREIYEDQSFLIENANAGIVTDKSVIGQRLKAVEATITIAVWEEGHENKISHADIGAPDNMNEDFSHGFKALFSDAFKRAGVHFGIAAPFYYLPKMWLEKNDTNFKMNGDKPGYMKPAGEAVLNEQYVRWLKSEGVKKFGLPI
jgi:hypothetical protein